MLRRRVSLWRSRSFLFEIWLNACPRALFKIECEANAMDSPEPEYDDIIEGKSLKELVEVSRNVFELVLKDERLAPFEPVADPDGEFLGSFFGAYQSDLFYCVLEIHGPKQASLNIACHLNGQTTEPADFDRVELRGFGDVDSYVHSMAYRVGWYMEDRYERLKDTLRLRKLEVSTTMKEDIPALEDVRVKTYRYGVTSWDALMRLRGPPTVHVIANGENGRVPDDGSVALVFTRPRGEPIWERSRSRAETTQFLLEVEKLFV